MRITYIRPPGSAGSASVPHAVLAELRVRGHEAVLRDAEAFGAADGAVIVPESAPAGVIAGLGRARAEGGCFRLLFHDDGGRGRRAPDDIPAPELARYDAVLVGADALGAVYRGRGLANVRSWRAAVDVRHFSPPRADGGRRGVLCLSDWGDAARGEELVRLVLRPARETALPLTLLGRGYPDEVAEKLAAAGVALSAPPPEAELPKAFAQALVAVELTPGRVGERLPGLVTPTVLQALACGVPLIVTHWRDGGGLFTPGEDLLVAEDASEVTGHLVRLQADDRLRAVLSAQGRLTVLARHSASHRAEELLRILAESDARAPAGAAG